MRPTSETMFCDHFSHVLHSYRDLPMLYNQWCSVVRWEKSTRPFLRTREFWWQEGHTIHETAEEAKAETEQQLNCYADFAEHDLCIPVLKGRKTDKEKFAGAEAKPCRAAPATILAISSAAPMTLPLPAATTPCSTPSRPAGALLLV